MAKLGKTLPITEMGNALLRQKARQLSKAEIKADSIQNLILNMQTTLAKKQFGVALAAPQVGESVALTVVNVQPTEHRPKVESFELAACNPRITKTFGKRVAMWEGCISVGKSSIFAQVPRYQKVEVEFLDTAGNMRLQLFEGLQAQIMQHEIDHLNGKLFVDHVTDTTTYMTLKEYKKQVVAKRK